MWPPFYKLRTIFATTWRALVHQAVLTNICPVQLLPRAGSSNAEGVYCRPSFQKLMGIISSLRKYKLAVFISIALSILWKTILVPRFTINGPFVKLENSYGVHVSLYHFSRWVVQIPHSLTILIEPVKVFSVYISHICGTNMSYFQY